MLSRFTTSLIVKITYGQDILSENDPLVSLAVEAATLTVREGNPGCTLHDFFPMRELCLALHRKTDKSHTYLFSVRFLPSWLPGAGFKKRWRYIRRLVETMINEPFELVQKNRVSTTDMLQDPSVTAPLISIIHEIHHFPPS